MDMLAKIFGFIGIACTVIIYQQKTRNGLLISKLVSDVIWFLHYFLLGAYSGAAVAVIAMARELIFMNRSKPWAKSRWWLVFFLVLSGACAVLTWKNVSSILPAMGSIISIIGFWIGSPRLSRFLSFPTAACMLSYDIICGSVAGIFNEILTVVSSIIGIIRHDIKQKKEN